MNQRKSQFSTDNISSLQVFAVVCEHEDRFKVRKVGENHTKVQKKLKETQYTPVFPES